jgi:STE24 endopeptidase
MGVMGRLRIPAAVVTALGAAEAAVLLLRPREGVIDPAPVGVGSYFSRAEIGRARDFHRSQAWLRAVSTAIEAGLLAYLVARPPRARRGPWQRQILGAAAVGAGLSIGLEAVTLPVHVVMRRRARRVGLVTQSWAGYARDSAVATTVGAVIAGTGAAAGVALVRRLPRSWWLPGAGMAIGFSALGVYAAPVVLDPLFNTFRPLPDGPIRRDVLELARLADVAVDRVLVMDASRRTTAANAYVTGLGATKRVVLFDTLLEGFRREEVRLVVAHELAHVHYRDVQRGLLLVALVAPPGLFLAAAILSELDRSAEAGPQTVPALAAALALVSIPVSLVASGLSRRVEARADTFTLRLTHAPEDFISFWRGITLRNVADPQPSALRRRLLASHPPPIERIGIAVAFAGGKR